jgi:GDSL-like Lipase/Acylhydrolase family
MSVTAADPSGHVVLLGDSIFDNAAYVPGEPDVVTQLGEELPPGWSATLLAVDGDQTGDVGRQLRRLPREATHLVVSAGGNDALGYAHLLGERSTSVADGVEVLGRARDRFAADYAAMVGAVTATGLPTALCSIYDTRLTEPSPRVIRTALTLFNDCITRAAFARGLTLLDLRLVCHEDTDYANPIEPSAHGGRKIARAIAALLDPGRDARRAAVVA